VNGLLFQLSEFEIEGYCFDEGFELPGHHLIDCSTQIKEFEDQTKGYLYTNNIKEATEVPQ